MTQNSQHNEKNRLLSEHIIKKCQVTEDERRFPKKNWVIYKVSVFRMTWDFPTATLEAERQHSNVFKVWRNLWVSTPKNGKQGFE